MILIECEDGATITHLARHMRDTFGMDTENGVSLLVDGLVAAGHLRTIDGRLYS